MGSDDAGQLTDLIYRTILRRESDPGGREHMVQELEAGASVIDMMNRIADSDEFRGSRLVSKASQSGSQYDPGKDEELARFATEEVTGRSIVLRDSHPISMNDFERVARVASDEFRRDYGGFEGQDVYLSDHRERFREMANLIVTILNERGISDPHIIDVGFSINTMILATLLPKAEFSVWDRFKVTLLPSIPGSSAEVDLASPELATLELDGNADFILFAEVIEHVLANPVRMLSFLIRHLAPEGRLILTTPNFFRHALLQQISGRENPQPVLPIAAGPADTPHFHVREFAMKELLRFTEQAGGRVEAFFYSPCWDTQEVREHAPEWEWANLVLVIRRV